LSQRQKITFSTCILPHAVQVQDNEFSICNESACLRFFASPLYRLGSILPRFSPGNFTHFSSLRLLAASLSADSFFRSASYNPASTSKLDSLRKLLYGPHLVFAIFSVPLPLFFSPLSFPSQPLIALPTTHAFPSPSFLFPCRLHCRH